MRTILVMFLSSVVLASPALGQQGGPVFDADANVRRTQDGGILVPRAPEGPAVNAGEPVNATQGPTPETVRQLNGVGEHSADLPAGAVQVDPNKPGPSAVSGRQPSPLPVVGATRLLESLDELDKPLTPEEITAYAATVQRTIPLRPELITDFRKRLNDVERAQAAPPTGFRPQAITDSVRVPPGTSGAPPRVLTSRGTGTVVSFFDRTGAPWPVASYVIGNEDAFQVYPMQEGSNQLAVSPLVAHGYSNIIVTLVDSAQPLVVDVETNEERSHFRLDITVTADGPNARIAPVVAKVPEARSSDGIMMAFVQGAPIPPDANELRTNDPDVEAYQLGDRMYVRTNQTLISPSYEAAISGPGGINTYRLRPAPVALISRNGSVQRVRISK